MKPRTERILDVAGGVLVLLLAIGWTWTIATAGSQDGASGRASAASRLSAALTRMDAPTAAYLTDASLNALTGDLRGASGKLRAQISPVGATIGVDSLPEGTELRVAESGTSSGSGASGAGAGGAKAVPRAGIFKLAVALGTVLKPIADFTVIGLRPRSDKQNGRVGGYFIGSWPGEAGGVVRAPARAPSEKYRPPPGFIEVSRENADTRVSEHFRLRDFLTHDQANVWPKMLVLDIRNVDKLEAVLNDLAARGVNVSGVRVMSGFRTPQYNVGGGNTGGRAGLSRHMYGDAADVYIDSNGDGVMDDLDHDGKITIADSRVIQQAVDRVEAQHPELVGGAGVYPAAAGHGPFIHIDTRGYRARWVGSGSGG